MNLVFKKFAAGTAVLALAATVFASGAMAENTSTSTGVTAGSLDLSGVSAASFIDSATKANVVLNGTVQTVESALNIGNITDATGSGAGWKVNVTASPVTQQITDGAGNVTAGVTLSGSVLNLQTPTTANVTVGAGSDGFNTLVPTGGKINTTTGVKMLSAVKDGGMGSYTVSSVPMTLTLNPNEVYAGSYATTITVELTTGP